MDAECSALVVEEAWLWEYARGDMPTDTDAKAQRRQEILTAAKQAFAELGYHRASVSEIISRAGIARGTFYLYFNSKQGVFDSLLDEALADLRSRISRVDVSDGAPSPRAQLYACFMRVLGYVLDDLPLAKILLNRAGTPDVEAAERLAAFYDHVRELVGASLSLGITMGLVRPCDPRVVAAAIVGALHGILEHLMSVEPPADPETVTREVMDFCLRAVLVEDAV
jgi:AcrR family transcriptional regulator